MSRSGHVIKIRKPLKYFSLVIASDRINIQLKICGIAKINYYFRISSLSHGQFNREQANLYCTICIVLNSYKIYKKFIPQEKVSARISIKKMDQKHLIIKATVNIFAQKQEASERRGIIGKILRTLYCQFKTIMSVQFS